MSKEYFDRYLSVTVFVVMLMMLILAMRIYQLQILHGRHYREAANSNKIRVIALPAARGIIYDRNNVPLVKNEPYYYASFMSETTNTIDTAGLSALLDIDRMRLIAKLKKAQSERFKSIVLKEGLSFKDVARIEARLSDFPGLMIEPNLTRHYVFDSVGSHVIGYIGRLTARQMLSSDYDNITPETLVGQWAAEAFLKKLRGSTGERIIEIDALGRELNLIGQTEPQMGNDITLSIDIGLQETAEKAFHGKTVPLSSLIQETARFWRWSAFQPLTLMTSSWG